MDLRKLRREYVETIKNPPVESDIQEKLIRGEEYFLKYVEFFSLDDFLELENTIYIGFKALPSDLKKDLADTMVFAGFSRELKRTMNTIRGYN